MKSGPSARAFRAVIVLHTASWRSQGRLVGRSRSLLVSLGVGPLL